MNRQTSDESSSSFPIELFCIGVLTAFLKWFMVGVLLGIILMLLGEIHRNKEANNDE